MPPTTYPIADPLEVLVLAYARYCLATAVVEDMGREIGKHHRRYLMADLCKHEPAMAEAVSHVKRTRGVWTKARDEWKAAAAALDAAEQAFVRRKARAA